MRDRPKKLFSMHGSNVFAHAGDLICTDKKTLGLRAVKRGLFMRKSCIIYKPEVVTECVSLKYESKLSELQLRDIVLMYASSQYPFTIHVTNFQTDDKGN